MKPKKKLAAFYPSFNGNITNEYVFNMSQILSAEYKLISFRDIKCNLFSWPLLSCVYLNWLEVDLLPSDMLCLSLMRLSGVKIIWVFHNRLPHNCKDPSKFQRNYAFLANISSIIIIHSNASADEPKKYLKSWQYRKIKYLPHVNYIKNYPKTISNIRAEKHLENDFIFLFLGLVRPYKNLEILIDSFVTGDFTDSKLIIAGKPTDTSYSKFLKNRYRKYKDIIMDFNFIPRQSVQKYIQAADVLVYPYDKYSSLNSGAMIMAFSCARTVIVPDIAMARDFFVKGFIYMYHYDNKNEHRKKLLKEMRKSYMNGHDYNKQLGNKAYEYVKEHCSEETVKVQLMYWLNHKTKRKQK